VSKWKKEKAQVHQTEFKDNVINNAQQQQSSLLTPKITLLKPGVIQPLQKWQNAQAKACLE
jgi:hypothetical protein